MFKKRFVVATAAILASAFSAHADTGIRSSASTTIRIQAFVPVLCRVRLAASVGMADDQGIVDLGAAHEFCNAPRGYRVMLQHPADLVGAAIISDGQRIPLSPSGETVLTDSTHADLRTVMLSADLGDEPDRFRSISVRIEPKS